MSGTSTPGGPGRPEDDPYLAPPTSPPPPQGRWAAGPPSRPGPVHLFGLTSTGGGVLAVLAGVLSLLAGAYLLLAEPTAPVPMGEDGRVVLERSPGLSDFPAVVYAPAELTVDGGLEGLDCRAERADGDDAGTLADFGERDRTVDGRLLEAVAETARIRDGGTVVCDGPALATEGLAVGRGYGSTRTAGVFALVFGLFALAAGAGFLAVGAGTRSALRRGQG